jgi:hypothetical protein
MNETTQKKRTMTHFDEVYQDTFYQLVAMLKARFELHDMIIVDKLFDYADTHGKEAVIDLHGWCDYCKKHDISNGFVSIMHDLNQMDTDFFAPRTHGYALEMYGEGFVDYKIEFNIS